MPGESLSKPRKRVDERKSPVGHQEATIYQKTFYETIKISSDEMVLLVWNYTR